MPQFEPNTLYYGDNLEVLRGFPSECVDLVYLDPPFNSARSYNVLFREAKGTESEAQIEAFGDTWQWGEQAAATYDEIVRRGDDVGRILQALVSALGHNDVTAYLTMMAPRLVELSRVLKPTGAIYLHCDPTASHYLKVLMDAVFGVENFANEIVWKRTTAHSDSKRAGRIHDTLLFYHRGSQFTWNAVYQPYDEDYTERYYRYKDPDGRRFASGDVAAAGAGPARLFNGELREPPPGSHWRFSQENIDRLIAEGRIFFTKNGFPRYKRYLDEMPGMPLQDIWADTGVRPVVSWSREGLGYPTQKPEALLERIIAASSNEGDVVLDPFCGCGTATVAAHRLGRRWVGIDITYLAVDLMRRRISESFPHDFPTKDDVPVDGDPADEAAALALAERDKYQFQYWAVAKLEGTARGGVDRKGMDRGVDGGLSFPERDPDSTEPTANYKQVIISVKGGGTGPADVRDLRGTVEREGAAIGVLVTAHAPTREMLREAASSGVYRSTWDDRTYPRLQIITAGEIVHGKRIEMPSQRSHTDFSRAPIARTAREQGRLGL